MMDALAGVLTGIDVDVSLDVNVNAFAGVIAVKFGMPAALGGSKC